MSTTYSAGVFFGVAFRATSNEGRKLLAYIDREGGTPAPCPEPGVWISTVGSAPTGETWVVAWAAGGWRSFERGDEVAAPELLEEGPGWADAVGRFLWSQGIRTAPTIGWRFYGSVT